MVSQNETKPFNEYAERFLMAIEALGLSDYKVWNSLPSLSKGTMSKIRTGRTGASKNVLNEFASVYTEVSPAWLLTGEGSMFREESHIIESQQTDDTDEPLTERTALKVYYELEATASNVIGFDDNERNQPFRLLNIPEFAGCIGMMVSGDSMYPSIQSGSIVAIDPTPASYIINGETYLVVTRDGQRMIKRLVQQGEKVRCISDNPDKELYAPFEIEAEIIHTISRVRGSVSVRSL